MFGPKSKIVTRLTSRIDNPAAKFVAQKTKKFQKQDTSPEIPSLIHSSKTKYKSEDNSWKVEESKKFTVAPAYNKGAYQVIPRGDVKWIGK